MRSGIKRFLLGYIAKYSAWQHGIVLISEKSTIRHVKFDKSTRGDSQTVNIFLGGVIDVCDFYRQWGNNGRRTHRSNRT